MLTAERLRELLHYDPETGVFTWIKITGTRVRVGDVAGSLTTNGYRRLAINGKSYKAHRLAWLYVTGGWPSADLDHINGVPGDDRWANLRLATRAQNGANSRRAVNNKSGFKGVSWHAQNRKWVATIMVNGRNKHLGYFDDRAAAHEAYTIAAREYFGEFARAA
jgi:hypothetical protein